MSTYIEAKNWLIFLQDTPANWEPIVCMIDGEVDFTSNTVEVKTKCDNNYATQLQGAKTWSIKGTFSARTTVGTGEQTWTDIFNAFTNGTLLSIRFGQASPSVSQPVFSGSARVTNFVMKAPVEGAVSFDATFAGNGEPTLVSA